MRDRKAKKGLFITFEGIEGAGKTTQLRLAAERLSSLGLDLLVTRQPGGTPLGVNLRRALLDAPEAVDPRAELLLMFADRVQHLAESIEPALAEGRIVLCDRYTDASRAYQGAGRRLGIDTVNGLHETFCRREPDRTYVFDCPVPTALARLAARGAGRDKIEREGLAFHRRVRAAYRTIAQNEPRRVLLVDAAGEPDHVFQTVAADLAKLLEGRHTDARRPAAGVRRA